MPEHHTTITIGGTELEAVVHFDIESYGEDNFNYPGHICDGGGSGPEIVVTSVIAGPLGREYLDILHETWVLPFRTYIGYDIEATGYPTFAGLMSGARSLGVIYHPKVLHQGKTALEAIEEEILMDASYFENNHMDDYGWENGW